MDNSLVYKSNKLVEARYSLNLNEQKIILYAVSKLDRHKGKFNILSLNVKEFTKLIGTTGERYTEIREIVRELRKKEVIIDTDERELITGWLASIDYIKDSGIVELEFSEKLIPYLLQLQKTYTRYQLKNILYLEHKYSIRIYELLKQYHKMNPLERKFKLDELKKILSIEPGQYTRIYDFERFVLKPAMEEINKHTDITMVYEKLKSGRRVVGILFKFSIKGSEDDASYIEYLNYNYDIADIKQKSGLVQENWNAKQIMDLLDIASSKAEDVDTYKYISLNYDKMIEINKARNKFSYLKKALENDYAKAYAQLKTEYIVD